MRKMLIALMMGRPMIEVTCECGWTTQGTEAEVVEAVQEHGPPSTRRS